MQSTATLAYGPSAGPRAARLVGWLTTVDHKRIGILYLVTAMVFFLFGGTEAFIMRLQLMRPDNHVVGEALFDQLFTMHGLTMIFLAIMPLQIGYMNFIVPLQIGARDVAFPRLNAAGYWLFLAGGLILYSSWLLGGAPNGGWYNYAPLSGGGLLNPGPDVNGINFYVLGLQIAGIGTLVSGINFLATIIHLRAPGMTPLRLPLFVWTSLITSMLIIFAFPPLTANLALLTFDRLFGTGFFQVALGGNVLLWQQLFWIFGHPEVYILVLPAFGMISEVVATLSAKPLFGYTTMVFATIVIAFLAFTVWLHHMFTVGMGPTINSVFAVSSMAIAVPTGVKIFNWIATLAGGRLRLNTALHFVLGFLLSFVIGGMSGVMLAAAPADYQYNGSYFVVAHIHYVLVGGSLFAILAGTFYWFPKITGRLLDERLGRWSFWLIFIGFNATFFPMHFLGLYGMPRRVATYPPGLGLSTLNLLSTLGVLVLTAGVLAVLFNIRTALLRGRPSGPDPWEDGRTLEWSLPSPVPEYNFAELPLVRGRDALWTEKMHGDGRLQRAPLEDHARHGDTVHLPSPTAWTLLPAGALTLAAYAANYHVWPLAAAALVLGFFAVFKLMYDPDPGHFVAVR